MQIVLGDILILAVFTGKGIAQKANFSYISLVVALTTREC